MVSLGKDHPSLYGLLDAAPTPPDQQGQSTQISPKMLSNRKEKRKKKD
jgi:hypothetical protein